MPWRTTAAAAAWSVHVEPDLGFGRYELFATLARPRGRKLTHSSASLHSPSPGRAARPLTCRNQRCPVIQSTCVEQSALSPTILAAAVAAAAARRATQSAAVAPSLSSGTSASAGGARALWKRIP